ncbi:hypothetical protein [Nonomuraea jabiensis]|uniref:Uncharacterized protein n=1 Tax=Nonomuraea jabiensis TaxID=882448 RepID=A0A7W9GIG7_9ACTN|nr:hypothetical protein [Nonomuraea jabiensis]MBB5784161.1 hypothetical protein [Nonomuraea jabiensis]
MARGTAGTNVIVRGRRTRARPRPRLARATVMDGVFGGRIDDRDHVLDGRSPR